MVLVEGFSVLCFDFMIFFCLFSVNFFEKLWERFDYTLAPWVPRFHP